MRSNAMNQPEKKCLTCQHWTKCQENQGGYEYHLASFKSPSQYGQCYADNLISRDDYSKPFIIEDNPDGGSMLYFREDFYCPLWMERQG